MPSAFSVSGWVHLAGRRGQPAQDSPARGDPAPPTHTRPEAPPRGPCPAQRPRSPHPGLPGCSLCLLRWSPSPEPPLFKCHLFRETRGRPMLTLHPPPVPCTCSVSSMALLTISDYLIPVVPHGPVPRRAVPAQRMRPQCRALGSPALGLWKAHRRGSFILQRSRGGVRRGQCSSEARGGWQWLARGTNGRVWGRPSAGRSQLPPARLASVRAPRGSQAPRAGQ